MERLTYITKDELIGRYKEVSADSAKNSGRSSRSGDGAYRLG